MDAPPFYDIRLKSFFRLMLVGPSGSGKTSWAKSLLQSTNQLMDTKPAKVIFYYNVWQNLYTEMEQLVDEFRQGVPRNIHGCRPTLGHLTRIHDSKSFLKRCPL